MSERASYSDGHLARTELSLAYEKKRLSKGIWSGPYSGDYYRSRTVPCSCVMRRAPAVQLLICVCGTL